VREISKMIYRDQLRTILTWSSSWSSAEQICAISTLFSYLSDSDKRFVNTIVTSHKTTDDDVTSLEGAANNISWVERLLQEDPSRIAQDLLVHLPVVKNNSLVSHYMPLITKLLMHSINTDDLLEESRSILAYALLHPIFDGNPPYKEELIKYTNQIQQKMVKQDFLSDSSSGGSIGDIQSESLIETTDESDGHESDDDKNTFLVPGSGMEEVPKWLKSLRLHKYQSLFARLTYDEMLSLDQNKLRDVTQGARNKIIENVQKLRERHQDLVNIENELNKNNDLKSKQLGEYLQKMKVIIQTPMRSQFHQEGDIPTQYTRTLAKIYNQLHHLLYNTGTSRIQPTDQENLTTFLNCSNDALNNPCFKPDQKENILKWQEIIQTSFYRDQQPRKPKPGRNNQMARNRNLSNRTVSNRGSTRNIRGNSHSHQRSVPNPMSFSNNWSLQNSFPQKSQNFSPNTLSPPQNYHKRASSFDPHLISQRTPPYNSPDSLQNSQLSLQRSNQHSIQSSATSLGGDSDRIPDLNSLTSQMNLHI